MATNCRQYILELKKMIPNQPSLCVKKQKQNSRLHRSVRFYTTSPFSLKIVSSIKGKQSKFHSCLAELVFVLEVGNFI